MGLHHQLRASKARALLIELQGYSREGQRGRACRFDAIHPLNRTLRSPPFALCCKNGRIPRCCPGLLLLPRQASAAGSLVSDEKMDVRPRLALGNAVLRTAGSALCLAHDDKMVPSAGFAPAPPRSQQGMLLLHYEGSVHGVRTSRPLGECRRLVGSP